jgi:hypothetical protein
MFSQLPKVCKQTDSDWFDISTGLLIKRPLSVIAVVMIEALGNILLES